MTTDLQFSPLGACENDGNDATLKKEFFNFRSSITALKVKKHTIGHLKISEEELTIIQSALLSRDKEGYNNKIIVPFTNDLKDWLKSHYPAVAHDYEDILTGVFRRIKNEIIKADLEKNSFEISKRLEDNLHKECKSILPTEANKKKNLNLTKAEFVNLVEGLRNGNEQLIEQTYLAHFSKCISFLKMKTKCTKEEAYDSCMDALYQIREDLIKGKIIYGNLASYFTSRAIVKLYAQRKKNKINTLPLLEELDHIDETSTDDDLIREDLNQIVRDAINELGSECREIIKQYYYEELKLNEIATQFDKSHQAMRQQVTRCRNKLKILMSKDFYMQFASFFNR